MTLDEATEHAESRSGDETECSLEHGQLAECLHELARMRPAFKTAMNTLEQIATTPRNKGARRNAYATLEFLRTQLKTPNTSVSR
jgi:hypothetical protein